MEPTAKLLATPVIDWETFLIDTNKILGYSPTKTLDERIDKIQTLPAFVTAIENLNDKGSKSEKALTKQTCEHITITLLIHCDIITLLGFIKPGFLVVTPKLLPDNTVLVIATGSILKWKLLVLESAKELEIFNFRLLANSIYVILQRLGFEDIFEGMTRRLLSDSTFTIEIRKY